MIRYAKIAVILIALILIVTSADIVSADVSLGPLIAEPEINVVTKGNDEYQTIFFSGTLEATGEVSISLYSPEGIVLVEGKRKESLGERTAGETIERNWKIDALVTGVHLVQICVSVDYDKQDTPQRFKPVAVFPLYLDVYEGSIIRAERTPPARYGGIPKNMPSKNWSSNVIIYDPSENVSDKEAEGQGGRQSEAASYTIWVYVTGQMTYEYDSCGLTYELGVPGLTVEIDWDEDDDPTTRMIPSATEGLRHADYDITDMDGNYYFNFTLESNVPAYEIAPKLRVYTFKRNEAAINADNSPWGGQFATQMYFAIDSPTMIYHVNANLNLRSDHAGALRHLLRARQFATDEFNVTPEQIPYFIEWGIGTGYCRNNGIAGCKNLGRGHIVYDAYELPWVHYHEYGHYMHHQLEGGNLVTNDYWDPHWFDKETTYIRAWLEGWAEFFSAAAHMYWYRTEDVGWKEYDGFNTTIGGFSSQFLDDAQRHLDQETDWRKVEGAVACFFV